MVGREAPGASVSLPLPMLATATTGASNTVPISIDDLLETGEWVLDTKLDGVRAYAHEGRLINRLGKDITYRYPEVQVESDAWLDGEIVALDGRFESTLLRDQQERPASIKKLAESTPCHFIAFDMPELAREPWAVRRARLENEPVMVTPIGDSRVLFDTAVELGMEGVIAKRMNARYQFGKRSRDWKKFKTTRRLTCLVAGYEPGNGSRAHFGAMHLALLDVGGPVLVGRVGSGFTERDTHRLKARLDAGELLAVEVEALNVTSGRQLRHPVFRGVRTDVQPSACTIDQLDLFPTC